MTAFTARSKVTAEALRGEPGALVAARVTRPGGTTVATGPADAVDPVDDARRRRRRDGSGDDDGVVRI